MSEKSAFSPIYYLYDDIDTIIEEKGDMFTALRKVQWAKSKDVPKDPSKAKYEIRKWKLSDNGLETPNKGLTFMTEEGPDNCVMALIQNGFGNTKSILLGIKNRDDFRSSVETMYDESDMSDASGEYFDARELLLND